MASGVPIHEECLTLYDEIKIGKKWRYVTFRLADDNSKIIKEATAKDSSWSEFLATLPENECRYTIYDFDYVLSGGGARSKLIFIAWAPDTAAVKKKMVFSASKDGLKKKLQGIQGEVQASGVDELDYEDIKLKVSKGGTN